MSAPAQVAGEPPASVTATLQHISLIAGKRDRLLQAQIAAERQYITAVRRELDANRMTWPDVLACYEQLRAVAASGFTHRWREQFEHNFTQLQRLAANMPNGADGSWHGSTGWPLPDNIPIPINGIFVVYILLGPELTPVYVGSTKQFYQRMKAHDRDGKRWTSWVAHPCRTRQEAYEVERRFLRQYKPALNVVGGGDAG